MRTRCSCGNEFLPGREHDILDSDGRGHSYDTCEAFIPRTVCMCEGYYLDDEASTLTDVLGQLHTFEHCNVPPPTPTTDELVATLVQRLMTGEDLYPWPEATKDLALIARFLQFQRDENRTLHKTLALIVTGKAEAGIYDEAEDHCPHGNPGFCDRCPTSPHAKAQP